MKVLIDTNILISAALHPGSVPSKAFTKAVTWPNRGILCEQNIDELRRIFNRKFPEKINAMETFLSLALLTVDVIPVPEIEDEAEIKIRDIKDRAILRAALYINADILLTGDKDFLEACLELPKCMTAAEFIEISEKN